MSADLGPLQYVIMVVIGAVVGFVAGQGLRAKRHGSYLDSVIGVIGGFAAYFGGNPYVRRYIDGWPMIVILVVAGAFLALFIMQLFVIRKPPPAQQGRFRR